MSALGSLSFAWKTLAHDDNDEDDNEDDDQQQPQHDVRDLHDHLHHDVHDDVHDDVDDEHTTQPHSSNAAQIEPQRQPPALLAPPPGRAAAKSSKREGSLVFRSLRRSSSELHRTRSTCIPSVSREASLGTRKASFAQAVSTRTSGSSKGDSDDGRDSSVHGNSEAGASLQSRARPHSARTAPLVTYPDETGTRPHTLPVKIHRKRDFSATSLSSEDGDTQGESPPSDEIYDKAVALSEALFAVEREHIATCLAAAQRDARLSGWVDGFRAATSQALAQLDPLAKHEESLSKLRATVDADLVNIDATPTLVADIFFSVNRGFTVVLKDMINDVVNIGESYLRRIVKASANLRRSVGLISVYVMGSLCLADETVPLVSGRLRGELVVSLQNRRTLTSTLYRLAPEPIAKLVAAGFRPQPALLQALKALERDFSVPETITIDQWWDIVVKHIDMIHSVENLMLREQHSAPSFAMPPAAQRGGANGETSPLRHSVSCGYMLPDAMQSAVMRLRVGGNDVDTNLGSSGRDTLPTSVLKPSSCIMADSGNSSAVSSVHGGASRPPPAALKSSSHSMDNVRPPPLGTIEPSFKSMSSQLPLRIESPVSPTMPRSEVTEGTSECDSDSVDDRKLISPPIAALIQAAVIAVSGGESGWQQPPTDPAALLQLMCSVNDADPILLKSTLCRVLDEQLRPLVASGGSDAPYMRRSDDSNSSSGSSSVESVHVRAPEFDDQSMQRMRINVSEILFENRIGVGSSGSTYAARWAGRRVAVKVVGTSGSGNVDSWQTEVQLLKTLDHPNIIQFMGYIDTPPTYIVVLEYCSGGDVYTALRKGTPPRFFQNVANGLVAGMSHLHAHSIIHRDLKSSNLLLDVDAWSMGGFAVKLIDFGVARHVTGLTSEELTTETGTYRWMAPEVIRHEDYSAPADVFSFGMVLYELLTHEVPHADLGPIQAAMATGLQGVLPPLPSGTPSAIKGLIRACWTTPPSARPTFEDLVNSLLPKLEAALQPAEVLWLDEPDGHPVVGELDLKSDDDHNTANSSERRDSVSLLDEPDSESRVSRHSPPATYRANRSSPRRSPPMPDRRRTPQQLFGQVKHSTKSWSCGDEDSRKHYPTLRTPSMVVAGTIGMGASPTGDERYATHAASREGVRGVMPSNNSRNFDEGITGVTHLAAPAHISYSVPLGESSEE